MDVSSLERLAPEIAILIVVLFFVYRGMLIFKEIVEKIDVEHHNALKQLSDAIDKNTTSTDKLTELTGENLQFMRRLNGKLEGAVIAKAEEKQLERDRADELSYRN
jgi:hypothetical protein